MTDVITLGQQIAASENLRGKCGRLCGLIGDHQMGTNWSVPSIGSANAAFEIALRAGYVLGGLEVVANFTPDMVGWLVHFEYHDAQNNGHMGMLVGAINGRAVMISMTSNRAGFIEDLGNGMFLSYVDEYAKSRPLRGITAHMGNRPQIQGLTSPYAPNEADRARVRRNAAYLNSLGLGPRSGAEDDGIRIDPPVTNKTVSRYFNLVQLWAKSKGLWNDSYGPPYLAHTMAADAALTAFLDAGGDKPTPAPEPTPTPTPDPEPDPEPTPDPPVVEPEPTPEPENPAEPEPEEPANPEEPEEDPVSSTPNITPAEVPTNILGVIIKNASARFWVYAIFFLAALVIRELVIGYLAAVVASQAGLEAFALTLTVATAVVADLSPFVAVLAVANTPAGKTATAAAVAAVADTK